MKAHYILQLNTHFKGKEYRTFRNRIHRRLKRISNLESKLTAAAVFSHDEFIALQSKINSKYAAIGVIMHHERLSIGDNTCTQ